ncbi:hypothetical protein GWK47_035867 [Chionoecetes opilio]|uniref:Uncharacterized protein n=1 Tax=Chionoecetes opilio TaxID=41210 RepID=A0A8J4YET4_CHIOP|nr:hypothetical protein GWK47_035867 [Chionoecetes opilio]
MKERELCAQSVALFSSSLWGPLIIYHTPQGTTATGSFPWDRYRLFQFPTSSNMGQSQSGDQPSPSKKPPRDHRLPETSPLYASGGALRTKAWLCRGLPYDIEPHQWTPLTRPRDKREQVAGTCHFARERKSWSGACCCLVCLPLISVKRAPLTCSLQSRQLLPLFSEKAATAAMVNMG